MNNKFKNIKVYVPNAKISKLVQNKLFDMGFYWYEQGKTCYSTDKPYLYSETDFRLSHGVIKSTFEDDSNTQLHYLQILTGDLDGELFKMDGESRVYYLSGDRAYWVIGSELRSVEYGLNKRTILLDVNGKEIIMNNKMPKLEAGKHVVRTKSGLALVIKYENKLAFSYLKGNSWDYKLDIVNEVYTIPHPMHILNKSHYNESNLIWSYNESNLICSREDETKSKVRKEYEQLQEQIKQLQEQTDKLGSELL